MSFAAADLTVEPRSFSIGPNKVQLMTFSAASGDTSGTVTADQLIRATQILIPGVKLTSAPTFSGNVVTLAFANPAATIAGTLIVIGA